MAVNKVQVQKNFGQNAVNYDQYAGVQKQMAQELMEEIKNTGQSFDNILEIGCGTGFLTEMLARGFPQAQIIATDIAPEMLVIAQKKLKDFSHIKYLVADGENLLVSEQGVGSKQSFNLIVSNAVFQWFSDCSAAVAQYYLYLQSGGYLMFTTFGDGTFAELYDCLQAEQGDQKSGVFLTGKQLQEMMVNAQFQGIRVEETTKKEYFSSCRCFLKALKMIGAHSYLTEGLNKGLGLGIFSFIKRYEAMFVNEVGVEVTYRCLMSGGQKIKRQSQ